MGRMENPEIWNRNRNRNRTNKWIIQVGEYDWNQYSSSPLCIPRKMDDDTQKKWLTKALEKGMDNTALITIT